MVASTPTKAQVLPLEPGGGVLRSFSISVAVVVGGGYFESTSSVR